MNDNISESFKIQVEDRARLIYYILYHIHELKDILSCSICLELLDKPTITNCGHVFCKSCLYQHTTYYLTESITPCPICMGPLLDFNAFLIDEEFTEAVKFIKQVFEVTKTYDINTEEPPTYKIIFQKVQDSSSKIINEALPDKEVKTLSENSNLKDILKARKCVISTDNRVFLFNENLNVISEESVNPCVNILQSCKLQPETEEQDLFDKLISKEKRMKTYKSHKQNTSSKCESLTKVKCDKAVEWLQDIRNHFETPPSPVESNRKFKQTIPKFDMPSISQSIKKQQSNSKPSGIVLNKNKRLTRSMGNSSKIVQAKSRERHSIAACDNVAAPLSNDEMKSFLEGLQELEVQCLNNIDKEMLSKEIETSESKIVKSASGKTSNLRKNSGSIKNTSNSSLGLNKFKEIKKIISKTERKPQPVVNLDNSPEMLCPIVTPIKNVDNQPIVVIEKCPLIETQSGANRNKRKFDELKNIDDVTDEFPKSKKSDIKLTTTDLNTIEKPESPPKKLSDRKFTIAEKSKSTPGLKIKSKITSSNEKTDIENKTNVEEHEKEILLKSRDMSKNSSNRVANWYDLIFRKLTQNLDATVSKTRRQSVDDDIFNIPTQPLILETAQTKSAKLQEPLYSTTLHDNIKKMTVTLDWLQKCSSQLKSDVKESISNSFNGTLKLVSKYQQDFKNADLFSNFVDLGVHTDPIILNNNDLVNDVVEMAIQTDFDSPPRGFCISSTDMFNTPSITNAETQTNCIVCSNCNNIMSNFAVKSQEGYVLSESFNNIQFETQDIINRNLTLQLRSHANAPSSYDVENQIPSVSVSPICKPTKRSKRLCTLNLTDELVSKTENQTSQISKSPKPISSSLRKKQSNNELLNKNLEEDIFKEKLSELRLCTQSEDVFKEKLGELRLCTQSEASSSLKKISQKEGSLDIISPTSNLSRRTSKRLRTLNSVDELLPKDVKRNKYIKENVSLQFLSEEDKNSNILSGFSDYSKYDECLDNILKKYDETPKASEKVLQVTSKTQKAIEECKLIINEACSDAIAIENTENLDKTVKYPKKKPSPLTLAILQDEFSKDFDNANKNTINSTVHQSDEVVQPEKQILAATIFEDNLEEKNMSLEQAMCLVEIGNVEELNETKKVLIHQNIVVPQAIDNDVIAELNKSSDVFLSDSDVIETTPQKNQVVSCEELLSQAYYNPAVSIVLPPLVEESPDIVSSLNQPPLTWLNNTFTPPPEFQSENNPEDLNNTDDSQSVTLKPDSVQMLNTDKPILSSVTQDIFMGVNNMITSTPADASQIMPYSLNFSPIKSTCKESVKLPNPIEAAESSMVSPLNVVKSQNKDQITTLRPLGSSTPKQKSILSYIRNTKPCVTSTRLTKHQVATIAALANKNLITYTTNFNPSVTHLVISVDEQQCISDHTMKYISAVSAGIWIVSFDWIQHCLNRGQIVYEEEFEAMDLSGLDGPKQSRLNRISNPLLRNYKIYISSPFQAVMQKEIEDVIVNLGGEVVHQVNELLKKNGKICLAIAESKSFKDYEIYSSWLEKFKVVTVEMEWLSRSVGQYEVISFCNFCLCSEDHLSDLGYPPELITQMPSYSHNALSSA